MMASDIQLMVQPGRTYKRLLDSSDLPAWAFLRRPALIAVVVGTSLTVGATASVSFASAIPMIAWWGIVPLIQLICAALLAWSAPRRPVSLARAIDLLLAGHAPWSLWLLAISACFALGFFNDVLQIVLVASALCILVWRAAILYHFCRIVLGARPSAAVARTVAHQAVIWGVFLTYACWAIAFDARY